MRDRGLTRRALLADLSRLGAGVAALPAAQVLAAFLGREARAAEATREARFYEKRADRKIECHLCPLRCVLAPGETCFCRTRTNRDGTLLTTAYGNPTVLRVDPVEKTPLHHVVPGARTLALGTPGCNLRCLYCQNFEQSQKKPADCKTVDLPVETAARDAKDKECGFLAFTYTEPVVFFDYALDLATFARERGVRSVVASAAFVEPAPLKELCKVVSGFALALKGFTDDYYRKVCGSQLKPVLRALETVKEQGVWLEVTTLVVPTLNDGRKELGELAKWVHDHLGPKTPLHFSRFVPEYRLRDLPPTPIRTLEDARKIAQDAGLEHVYLSNVAPHEGSSTYCPGCKRELVKRVGFKVLANDLGPKGECPGCRRTLPGLWK